jgi:hypothetical protein
MYITQNELSRNCSYTKHLQTPLKRTIKRGYSGQFQQFLFLQAN